MRGAGGGRAFAVACADSFFDERMAVGDGDWGVGGAFDLVVSAEIAGVAAVVGEPGTGGGSGRDYDGVGERVVFKRREKNLHRGHGERRGHREEGERIVLGVVEATLSFADGDAGDFSGFADGWVLWICELGAYVFVEARSFAFAFAGVHVADCAGFAAGAALGCVYIGQDGDGSGRLLCWLCWWRGWDWDLGIRLPLRLWWDLGRLLTLANYWFSAAFHAYQAELFPTRLRATGVGFTYSWSRLSAAFTSILIGAVLVHGVPAVFAVLAVAMILVAGVVAVMGPRTNGLVLEEIAR